MVFARIVQPAQGDLGCLAKQASKVQVAEKILQEFYAPLLFRFTKRKGITDHHQAKYR